VGLLAVNALNGAVPWGASRLAARLRGGGPPLSTSR